ncbi:hypothetical protein MN608_00024 [Microdochium nivale]|nr:hypothetical protein MN608_00024 [Microdochium nivale]
MERKRGRVAELSEMYCDCHDPTIAPNARSTRDRRAGYRRQRHQRALSSARVSLPYCSRLLNRALKTRAFNLKTVDIQLALLPWPSSPHSSKGQHDVSSGLELLEVGLCLLPNMRRSE